jgi:hypothetical protein
MLTVLTPDASVQLPVVLVATLDKLPPLPTKLCVNVYFYDNAYMVEVSGRNEEDDWKNVKLNCKDLTEVQRVLEEVNSLPRE